MKSLPDLGGKLVRNLKPGEGVVFGDALDVSDAEAAVPDSVTNGGWLGIVTVVGGGGRLIDFDVGVAVADNVTGGHVLDIVDARGPLPVSVIAGGGLVDIDARAAVLVV